MRSSPIAAKWMTHHLQSVVRSIHESAEKLFAVYFIRLDEECHLALPRQGRFSNVTTDLASHL